MLTIESLIDPQQGFVFGESRLASGGRYGPLQKPYVTLLMVHAGAARVIADGEERSVVAGECGFFINRQSMSINYQQHLRTHVSWCEAYPATTKLVTQPLGKLRISERLLRLQRMGIELGLESSSSLNTFRNALGMAVFAAYLLESRRSEVQQRVSPGLLRVRDYIDAHYATDTDLAKLAEVAALTPTHLVAAYSRQFGTTPIRQLWSVRAARARTLLLRSNLSQAEIAWRCGFKNQFHFSRKIKQQFGQTPTQIREGEGFRIPSDLLENIRDETFQ